MVIVTNVRYVYCVLWSLCSTCTVVIVYCGHCVLLSTCSICTVVIVCCGQCALWSLCTVVSGHCGLNVN